MKTQSWCASMWVCLQPGLRNILINFVWDPNQNIQNRRFGCLKKVFEYVSPVCWILSCSFISFPLSLSFLCVCGARSPMGEWRTRKEGKMPNSPGNLSANFSQAISQNKNLKCKYCESVCVFCVYKLIYLRCLSFSWRILGGRLWASISHVSETLASSPVPGSSPSRVCHTSPAAPTGCCAVWDPARKTRVGIVRRTRHFPQCGDYCVKSPSVAN